MQHHNPDVGSRLARGERLTMRPDAVDRIMGARVVLRDDKDSHLSEPEIGQPLVECRESFP